MNLIWVNYSYFTFVDEQGYTIASGTLKTVVKAMLAEGFSMAEIDTAIESFDEHDHDVANFGLVANSFIYSDYQPEYDSLQASA